MANVHIRLNMIVKNEAPNIRGALDSVVSVISSFCIVDTGSQDDTIDEIRKWAGSAGVPGEIHKDAWVDFGTNRSAALKLAVKDRVPSHILFLDADDRVEVGTTFSQGEVEIGKSYKILNISGNSSYTLPQLVAVGERAWEWRAPLHEYLVPLGHEPVFGDLDALRIKKNVVQGGRSRGLSQREKYLRDAYVLQSYLEKQPNDARFQYYLGQSYRDAGEWSKAIASYRRRLEMPGWDQETYHAMLQIGLCRERLNQTGDAIEAYLDAWKFRRTRCDALYSLIRILRIKENYEIANLFVDLALGVAVSHGDTHFVDAGASRWRLFDEASIVKYWVGDHKKSLLFANMALEYEFWDPQQRLRIQKNARFAQDAIT